ncbi:hypothetical protein P872_14925 [Rhodonellum psychrophilum GCM71 = DSM 17998]|uniref:Carrier domain-containing protein n=2 Tax=Rhodonellum TaxID=336827 RepID=U5C5Z8_9BACT|nr:MULTISPECIES: non-ribosomal peptide synthetase [Rhodonellum]ERM84336.1 hypothetical protein P872_14925 [Rhodonellum psychrophilum GCM71 = DSM 17998]SDZ43000.1 amino acid adenylation domain-containing protein [Rhodonellum ikkaensis]
MKPIKPQFESIAYDPFETPGIEKIVGLLDSQKEIWVSCKLGGEEANLSNNLSISLKFTGDLNPELLFSALEAVVNRHEALRMTFSPDGKNCIIQKHVLPTYKFLEIQDFSPHHKSQAFQDVLDAEVTLPFDLVNGPLIRFSLLKLENNVHVLLITGHHIIVDGWSLDLITEELCEIYSRLLEKNPDNLPKADSFSEYSSEMTAFKESQEYRDTEQYWLEQFKGNNFYLELPVDNIRPEFRTYNSSRLDLEIDAELLDALRKLSALAKTSLVNTLMGAFEIYFHKLTGQSQLSLGIPVSGQAVSGNFSLVGHCVHLLPVPSKINPNLSFLSYLKQRKTELLDNYDHSQYTFSNLLQQLKIQRDNSKIPLVPFIINFESAKNRHYKFSGCKVESVFNAKKFETFENALYITEYHQSLLIDWQYNSNLYEADSIRKMLKEFRMLLKQVTENPETIISQIGLVKNEFLRRIQPWNETFLDYPKDKIFTKLISEQAQKSPDKIAITFRDEEISYLDLDSKSNQLAHILLQKGVTKGDIVGLCVDRSIEMVISLLGIVKSGAVYLPLDPIYPKDRIEMMVEDAACRFFLISRSLENRYRSNSPILILEELIETLMAYPDTEPQVTISGNDLVYVIYTSGSTGKPKGVKIEHHNLLNFLLSMQLSPGISADDKLLAVTTISFDIAGLELFLPLIAGAALLIADSNQAKDGRILVEIIEKKKITIMQATPATWRMMVNTSRSKLFRLKVLCGGEALSQDLALSLMETSSELWNVYGPTETTIWSLIKKIKDPFQSITIGHPIHNTQVYIVGENGNLLSPGEIGEIWIGGDGVSQGYLHRPELTQEKFVKNIFEPEKGVLLYRTGDLGKFLPNGELVCLGRMDNQVKIRGFRIELGEIENQLGQIPEIREAVVVAREDKPGDKKLIAYVIEENSETPFLKPELDSPGEIGKQDDNGKLTLAPEKITVWKTILKATLPEYMVPVDWVSMREFPKTANNKIDRKALPKPFISQVMLNSGKEQVKYQSNNQKLLAGIWSKVLSVPAIGLNDDFFELGGHSLIAVEVMSALEKETGLNLPLDTLFKFPTIASFSERLDNLDKAEVSWECLVPIKPTGSKTPVYLIHGAGANVSSFYGLSKNLDADQPVFGIQSKGLDGIEEPLHTIKEMAIHYIHQIIAHNPTGPYFLGGQSFGAYVAFEMGKQMKEMGLDIQKVILFDVFAYQGEKELTGWEKFKRGVAFEVKKRYVDMELLVHSPATFKNIKSHSFERKKRGLKKLFHLESFEEESRLFHTIEKIRKINHTAMDEYVLSPYHGEIVLFKAKIKTFYQKDMVFYGWRPYADKVLTLEIEGDHNSMFEDAELVKELAQKLQEVLDK